MITKIDSIAKLQPVAAESAAKLLSKYHIKGPTEPWIHVIAYGSCLIWYIWDTREIVYLIEIDSYKFPMVSGQVRRGRDVLDNGSLLVDKHNFVNNIKNETAKNKISKLIR